jgi:UDP-3-O-[3-hydroxymyristoyl] glucosamine N-acyltransferase
MEFSLGQIAALIGGTVEGNAQATVFTISSIEEAKPGSISFLSNPKYEPFIYSTKASGVIVNEDFKPSKQINTSLIRVKNAYLAFTALLAEYQRILSFSKSGIENPSYISSSATHGENLYLGAFGYLGENVRIGKNVKIYPHAYIGDNVTIGDNSIVYAGVKIYANCKIGNYCTLQAGCVIGSDGFGFAPKEDGTYENIPQIGNVVLEDHVDIGANATIDCATFESTIIRKGVKIDNLVQIAHNVEIGENTVIAAQSGVSGSTKVGKQVIMAGQVGIVGHIHIADRTILAAQSGIMKSTKEGDVLFGYPAIDKGDQVKSLVVFRKLPQLLKRVEELEEKILNLRT